MEAKRVDFKKVLLHAAVAALVFGLVFYFSLLLIHPEWLEPSADDAAVRNLSFSHNARSLSFVVALAAFLLTFIWRYRVLSRARRAEQRLFDYGRRAVRNL